mgnify:FL=1
MTAHTPEDWMGEHLIRSVPKDVIEEAASVVRAGQRGPLDEALVRALGAQGHTVSRIAEELGVSMARVSKFVQSRGIEVSDGRFTKRTAWQ